MIKIKQDLPFIPVNSDKYPLRDSVRTTPSDTPADLGPHRSLPLIDRHVPARQAVTAVTKVATMDGERPASGEATAAVRRTTRPNGTLMTRVRDTDGQSTGH